MTGPSNSSQILRKQLRERRRALTPQQQTQAARNLYKQLAHHPLFTKAHHIAFYLANDGEIDPKLLIAFAKRYKKTIYLPVLPKWPKFSMLFQAITPNTQWTENQYHIKEPKANRKKQVSAKQLDLILMPLVGFDEFGGRLGMGAGYYDRHLAYLNHRKHWQQPQLIGLAHDCQKVAKLQLNSWDIPLLAIVTDQAWYFAKH